MVFVYSMFDRKVKMFLQLQFARNDEEIRRALFDALRQEQGFAARYPEDYDLMCVGRFDEDTGLLAGTPVRFVLNCRQMLDEEVLRSQRALELVPDDRDGTRG